MFLIPSHALLHPEDEKKSEKKLLASPIFSKTLQTTNGKPPECVQSLFEMARHYFLAHWDTCLASDDVNALPKAVLIDLMRAKSMTPMLLGLIRLLMP